MVVYYTRCQTVLTETTLPMSYSVPWYGDFTNSSFKNSCNFTYVCKKITAIPKRSYPKLTNCQHNFMQISNTTFTQIGK